MSEQSQNLSSSASKVSSSSSSKITQKKSGRKFVKKDIYAPTKSTEHLFHKKPYKLPPLVTPSYFQKLEKGKQALITSDIREPLVKKYIDTTEANLKYVIKDLDPEILKMVTPWIFSDRKLIHSSSSEMASEESSVTKADDETSKDDESKSSKEDAAKFKTFNRFKTEMDEGETDISSVMIDSDLYSDLFSKESISSDERVTTIKYASRDESVDMESFPSSLETGITSYEGRERDKEEMIQTVCARREHSDSMEDMNLRGKNRLARILEKQEKSLQPASKVSLSIRQQMEKQESAEPVILTERDKLKKYKESNKYEPPLKTKLNRYMAKTNEMRKTEKEKLMPAVKHFRPKEELSDYADLLDHLEMSQEEQSEKHQFRQEKDDRKTEIEEITNKFLEWVSTIEPPTPNTPACIDGGTIIKMFAIGQEALEVKSRIPILINELNPIPKHLSQLVKYDHEPSTLQYIIKGKEAKTNIKGKKNINMAWDIPRKMWFKDWDPEYGFSKPEDMSISFHEVNDLLKDLMNLDDLANLKFD